MNSNLPALAYEQSNVVKILSATYGPSHGRRLMHGEVVPEDASMRIPYSRDVLPMVVALLDFQQRPKNRGVRWLREENFSTDLSTATENNEVLKRRKVERWRINEIPIMDGKSMNIIFGDPCPGTTKRLDIFYVFQDDLDHGREVGKVVDPSYICQASFAEHEQVVLKRKTVFFRHQPNNDKMKMNSVDFASANDECQFSSERDEASNICSPSLQWRLRNDISEIVLPILLPYLTLPQRVHCQQVCKAWKIVISEQGISEHIDVNEPLSYAPKAQYTSRILKGIISNSYSSLRRLFLNNYTALQPQDFHPAIPHLRKLTQLDVSRCSELTDETMLLIAQHLKDTLEVLYMKGLRNTTDTGLIAISKACRKLCVLEISNVPITDASGVAIGLHLHQLVALYMRDNYLLTNATINAIMRGCLKLTQLTLWGCTHITDLKGNDKGAKTNDTSSNLENYSSHLSINPECGDFIGPKNLIVLNLWGCHGLHDDSLLCSDGTLDRLRTLIVSECHQLSDRFVLNLVKTIPRLTHLHLRYVRRITDSSLCAIAAGMSQLYMIDLSFCNRISSSSIQRLLSTPAFSLAEIRLYSCRQIDECGFNQIINELDPCRGSSLNVLDIRECGVEACISNRTQGGLDVVKRLTTSPFNFTEPVPHYFVRPAVCNGNPQSELAALEMVTTNMRSSPSTHTFLDYI